MRYIFNPITEQLEAPDNPSPLYDNLGKKFKLAESVLPYDFDDLTPREEQYYQQDKFSTHPEFLAAAGGRVGFQDGSKKRPWVKTKNPYIFKRENSFIVDYKYTDNQGNRIQSKRSTHSSLRAAQIALNNIEETVAKKLGIPVEDLKDKSKTFQRTSRVKLEKLHPNKKHYWTAEKAEKFLQDKGLLPKKDWNVLSQKLGSGRSDRVAEAFKKVFKPVTIGTEPNVIRFVEPPTPAIIKKIKPFFSNWSRRSNQLSFS